MEITPQSIDYELYSSTTYTGDGTTKTFTVPFPYLYLDDVHVSVDGNDITVYPVISLDNPPSPFEASWYSDNIIRLVIAPAIGAVVKVYRTTNRATPEVRFDNSAILTEDDLNLITTQLLYVVQEAYDNFIDIQRAITSDLMTNLEITNRVVDRMDEFMGYAQQLAEIKSSLVTVADGIDDVVRVSTSIEDVKKVSPNIEALSIVADDLRGLPIMTMDLGYVTEGVEGINDPKGTILGTIANNVTELSAIGENVHELLTISDTATNAAAEAAQSASSAMAAEARIQELEQQIRELIGTNYAEVLHG